MRNNIWLLVFALTILSACAGPTAPTADQGKPPKKLAYQPFSGDVPLTLWTVTDETIKFIPLSQPRFLFPAYPKTRNYLFADVAYALNQSQTLVLDFTIDASPDAVFNADDGLPTPAPMPPAFTPFFWTGNSLSTIRERYWAFNYKTVMQGGVFHVEIPLTLANWFDVYGGQNAAAFATALSHVDHLGGTFGGSSTYGHGIGMSAGSATFTVTRLAIQ